ncbi:zinc-binding dehydrogenase [Niabella sp. 22666]|uniref:zinc-binding dehydrogenase n=1 Tax=Niabella sp. 22666 TaxID=3453954 RepID=UPI003F867A2F
MNVMSKGKIMVFNGAGLPIEARYIGIPELLPGEVLVRNRYATICGSDIHTFCGTREEALPTVLGHEIVGEIIALSPSHKGIDEKGKVLQPGDIITWSIFSSDPDSYYASHGMPQKGDQLFKYGHAKATATDSFHGGFGEYCILKKGTAILKIPPTVPLSIAATINCAISTVAGATRLAENIKGKQVLIFGTGLLGLTCIAMCREAGAAAITVADISEERLLQGRGFGADHLVLINEQARATISAIGTKTDRKGFDLVFDMSGSADAMELGLELMAIGGIAIWIGAVFKTRPIQVDAENIIRRLLSIKGLHNYNYEDFVDALDFITNCWDQYPFDTVVDKVFELDEVNEAFSYAVEKKPLRVGVKI